MIIAKQTDHYIDHLESAIDYVYIIDNYNVSVGTVSLMTVVIRFSNIETYS